MSRSEQLRILAALSMLSCGWYFLRAGLVGFSCFQSFRALVQFSALVFSVFFLFLFFSPSFFTSGGKAQPVSQRSCILNIVYWQETVGVLISVSAAYVCGLAALFQHSSYFQCAKQSIGFCCRKGQNHKMLWTEENGWFSKACLNLGIKRKAIPGKLDHDTSEHGKFLLFSQVKESDIFLKMDYWVCSWQRILLFPNTV